MKRLVLVVCLVLVGVGAAVGGWFYAAHRARSPEAVRKECISRLERLGHALEKYAGDNKGQLPAQLTDLYPGYIDSLKLCECPESRGSDAEEYRYDNRVAPDADFIELVVYDPPGVHEEIAMGAHAACVRKGRFVGVTTFSDDEIEMLVKVQDYAFDYIRNDSQSALQGLLSIMSESEGNIRRAAADVLRASTKPETPKLLVGELGKEDVKEQAATVLTDIGTGALQELIRACDDPKPSVRVSALKSIGDIGDESAVPVVFEKLTDADPDVRAAAAAALGKMPPAKVVSLLINALTQGDPAKHEAIIEAIPAIGESIVPQLVALLERGDSQSRQGAAFILGELKSEKGLSALGRATQDTDWVVASFAAEALIKIGDEAGSEYLTALLDRQIAGEGLAKVHDIAVIGLGTLGGDHARAKLREVLTREWEPHVVRSRAAYYLGQLQDREAVALLIDTMKNYYYLRPTAAEALKNITGQDFGTRPDLWQNWWDSSPQPPPLYRRNPAQASPPATSSQSGGEREGSGSGPL